MGTAVVLGELTASLVSPTVSPVTAVGGAVIDTVPPGVKEWAISLFGTADKVALLGGMALVIAALAALSGVLEVRRRFAGVTLIAVFGAVGLVAVLSRADLTANAIPVPVLVALVGMALLRWLIRRLLEWQPDAGRRPAGGAGPGGERPPRRRRPRRTPRPAPRTLRPMTPRPPGAVSCWRWAGRPPSPPSPVCSPPRSGEPPPSSVNVRSKLVAPGARRPGAAHPGRRRDPAGRAGPARDAEQGLLPDRHRPARPAGGPGANGR